MTVLLYVGIVYLTLGFIYAVYILIKGTAPWHYFLINMLGGPITVLYILYMYKKGKDLPTNF